MAVDERNRLQLAEAAKRALGDDEGITLMELLHPVGWAGVATKQDVELLGNATKQRLEILEHKFTATLERELRSQTWKLFAINAATMGGILGAIVALAKT